VKIAPLDAIQALIECSDGVFVSGSAELQRELSVICSEAGYTIDDLRHCAGMWRANAGIKWLKDRGTHRVPLARLLERGGSLLSEEVGKARDWADQQRERDQRQKAREKQLEREKAESARRELLRKQAAEAHAARTPEQIAADQRQMAFYRRQIEEKRRQIEEQRRAMTG
jgi:hypothetical protein